MVLGREVPVDRVLRDSQLARDRPIHSASYPPSRNRRSATSTTCATLASRCSSLRVRGIALLIASQHRLGPSQEERTPWQEFDRRQQCVAYRGFERNWERLAGAGHAGRATRDHCTKAGAARDAGGGSWRSGGPPPVVIAADLSQRGAARVLAAEAEEALGRIDILVNNAGGGVGAESRLSEPGTKGGRPSRPTTGAHSP